MRRLNFNRKRRKTEKCETRCLVSYGQKCGIPNTPYLITELPAGLWPGRFVGAPGASWPGLIAERFRPQDRHCLGQRAVPRSTRRARPPQVLPRLATSHHCERNRQQITDESRGQRGGNPLARIHRPARFRKNTKEVPQQGDEPENGKQPVHHTRFRFEPDNSSGPGADPKRSSHFWRGNGQIAGRHIGCQVGAVYGNHRLGIAHP